MRDGATDNRGSFRHLPRSLLQPPNAGNARRAPRPRVYPVSRIAAETKSASPVKMR
jgi:hypothetical protein